MDGKGTAPRVGGRNTQGFWEVVWSERHGPGAWRTRRVSTRTKDRAEADAFLEGFVTTLEAERAEARGSTVAALVKGYLEAKPHVGPTQRVHLRTIVTHLGDRNPAGLDDRVVAQFRTARAPAKDGTVRRDLGALNAVLAWAVRKKLIPAGERPHLDMPPEGAARDVWLRENERDAFWTALLAYDPDGTGRLGRVTLFGCVALETGARKRAIEGLTWDRVDLGAGLLDFRDPGLRATKKRRVPVPVSDRLRPVLERALAEARPGARFVLPGEGGSTRTAWGTWLASSGCPYSYVTPHVMRHTWATLAARAGVSMSAIAAVLGDTVTTIEKHYLHHSPDYLRAAVNARRAAPAPAVTAPAPVVAPVLPAGGAPLTAAELVPGLAGSSGGRAAPRLADGLADGLFGRE
jgi:integrase